MRERPRSIAPFLVALVVGAALIVGVRALVAGGDGRSDEPKATGSCTRVTMAASSEKAALHQQIATAYHGTDPVAAGRCVRMYIVSKSSGGAAEALARGWDDAIDGTRPDVWSPASSSWVVILRQRLAARDAPNIVPTGTIQHVAETPLVIAMPRPMAQALGWPSKPIGWGDVLALSRDPKGWGRFNHPEWGAFRLGKTNPNFSTSGLNATIASYFAATGRSSDLAEKDIRDPKVLDFVRGVESAVVHYGDITLTFLENLQKADDRGAGLSYISAVTVEEKSVWDYNKGNPTGDPKTLGRHRPPRTPLVAVYPKEGTLLSDNPYVVLNASWVDAAKRAAAEDFLKFLQRSDQQERFQKAAFRDYRGRTGDEITEANGLLKAMPQSILSPPSPPVLDLIQRSWLENRKRARVLLVIDVSGSMGQSVPKSGTTKLELAKRAAIKALDQFAKDDQVGLWVFSSDFPGGKPYEELLPAAPLGPQLARMKSGISALTPLQGTALYASIRAAQRVMRTGYDATRINAVVILTDGKNEYPADTDLDGLLSELQAGGEDVAIRVFPIAYGEDADLRVLRRIAEAARAAAYDSADPASIDKVFTAVVSNF